MKRYRIGRAALATMMSLALGLGVTACSRDYTVAFVYATSAQTGGVSAFDVDYQTGSLVQIAGSPFTSNLRNPVTLVVAPSNKFLYVIGGNQDDEVAEMAIGTDGKLYGQHTYNITGHSPTAAAIDASGSFLYVTFALQNAYTTIGTGPGGVTVFPINKDNSLGTPQTLNLGIDPIAVVSSPYQACNTTNATGGTCANVLPPCNTVSLSTSNPGLCHYLYVLDADATSSGTGAGQLLSFLATSTPSPTSTGLTPLAGTTLTNVTGTPSTATGVSAGSVPTAIAEDPTSRFVYVTDRASNQLYGYVVQGVNAAAPGTLATMNFGPFTTGQFPVSVIVDPRGKYLYTANFGSNTVSSYAIDQSSGNPSGAAGGNASVATGPTCVTIEPALGIYLFTSNRLDGSISGAQLDPHSGALTKIENSPFTASAQLSCVAAAANGEHSSSLVNP